MYCMFVAFEIGAYPKRAQTAGDVADVAEIMLPVVVFSAAKKLV